MTGTDSSTFSSNVGVYAFISLLLIGIGLLVYFLSKGNEDDGDGSDGDGAGAGAGAGAASTAENEFTEATENIKYFNYLKVEKSERDDVNGYYLKINDNHNEKPVYKLINDTNLDHPMKIWYTNTNWVFSRVLGSTNNVLKSNPTSTTAPDSDELNWEYQVENVVNDNVNYETDKSLLINGIDEKSELPSNIIEAIDNEPDIPTDTVEVTNPNTNVAIVNELKVYNRNNYDALNWGKNATGENSIEQIQLFFRYLKTYIRSIGERLPEWGSHTEMSQLHQAYNLLKSKVNAVNVDASNYPTIEEFVTIIAYIDKFNIAALLEEDVGGEGLFKSDVSKYYSFEPNDSGVISLNKFIAANDLKISPYKQYNYDVEKVKNYYYGVGYKNTDKDSDDKGFSDKTYRGGVTRLFNYMLNVDHSTNRDIRKDNILQAPYDGHVAETFLFAKSRVLTSEIGSKLNTDTLIEKFNDARFNKSNIKDDIYIEIFKAKNGQKSITAENARIEANTSSEILADRYHSDNVSILKSEFKVLIKDAIINIFGYLPKPEEIDEEGEGEGFTNYIAYDKDMNISSYERFQK